MKVIIPGPTGSTRPRFCWILVAEENRDGANDDRRWNCGAEGPSSDPAAEKLRNRVEAGSVVVLYAPGALSWPGANRTPKQEQ